MLAFVGICGKLRRVNNSWANPFFRSRYVLAIVAGGLLAGSFPLLGMAGLAWVAPGLMMTAALGKPAGESFRIGYVAGLAHYLTLLYWLLLIPYRWHGIPLAPAVGWLALSAFLALLPATWVWLVAPRAEARSQRTEARGQKSEKRGQGTEGADLTERLPKTWAGRALWSVCGAAVWVALEMTITRIFGGFPFDLLGVSQYRLVPLIQVASWTGVYGVSFLVVWFSLALLSAGSMMIRYPARRSAWVAEICVPMLAVAAVFNSGLRHLRHEPAAGRILRITLVQPSIPQTVIWDPRAGDQRFLELLQLTERALSNQTDVLIWPESALPRALRYSTNVFEAVTGLARRHRVWMIVSSDDAEPRRNAANPDEEDEFNSSFLISPEGRLMERYNKRNLVIFGEYVPHWLPLLKYFTPIQGGFTSGTKGVPFELAGLDARVSVLICFEDAFPQLARTDVVPDTDFLVNLTNDGWFGESAEQWQHAMSALFRTVETGRPLVRCSNNGLTCWIDAQGRLREVFRDAHGTVYGAGFMSVQLPVPAAGESQPLTFYTRHGDWFGWGCVGIAAVMLGRRLKLTLARPVPLSPSHCSC